MINPTYILLIIILFLTSCGETQSKSNNELDDIRDSIEFAHEEAVYLDSIRRANLTEWDTLNHDSVFKTIPRNIITIDSNLTSWRSFLLNSTYVDSILYNSLSEYTTEFKIYLMDMDANGEPEFTIYRDIYTIVDSVIIKLEYNHDGMTPFNDPIKLGNQTFIASGVGYGGRAGSWSYSIYSTYKKGSGFKSFTLPGENYNNYYQGINWPGLFLNDWDSLRSTTIRGNTLTSFHEYKVNLYKYYYSYFLNKSTEGIDFDEFEPLTIYKGKITINYTWKDTGIYITSKTDHPGFIDVIDGAIVYKSSISNPNYYTGDLRTCMQLEQHFDEHNYNLEEITQYLDEYYK